MGINHRTARKYIGICLDVVTEYIERWQEGICFTQTFEVDEMAARKRKEREGFLRHNRWLGIWERGDYRSLVLRELDETRHPQGTKPPPPSLR